MNCSRELLTTLFKVNTTGDPLSMLKKVVKTNTKVDVDKTNALKVKANSAKALV